MQKLILLGGLVAMALGGFAIAQVYTGPPNPTALVCAYNVTPASAINGQFYYVQCDSTGKIIVQ